MAETTSDEGLAKSPKVFISYNWTSHDYKSKVLDIADRLIKVDRVDVIIDEYDLKGSQGVVAFMEKLKTDGSITHVLVMCDSAYVLKAESRRKAVGVEAQIVSPDVYNDIGQVRVLPIVMERTSDGEPALPTFLRSQLYFDFSSVESMHREWERLGRHLWGKPLRGKPQKGVSVPKYLSEASGEDFVSSRSSWQALRYALHEDRPTTALLREELLDAFETEIAEVEEKPAEGEPGKASLDYWKDCLRRQNKVKDLLVDWCRSEALIDSERAVEKCIIPLLERIHSISHFSNDRRHLSPAFRDALSVFGYEMALYCTACLMGVDSPNALRKLLEHPFCDPDHSGRVHLCLGAFCHHSDYMEAWNQEQGRRWRSPMAERMIESTSHPKFNKNNLMEAEALIFMMSVLKGAKWYPYTAVYASHGVRLSWFSKARYSREPDRLALITGLSCWEAVRETFLRKIRELLKGTHFAVFNNRPSDYIEIMGM